MPCNDTQELLEAPYDHAKLDGMIGEVAGLLTELKYIDAVLAYISERHWPGPQVSAEQAYSEEIYLGIEFPFTRTLTVRVTGWDRWTFWSDEQAEEIARDLAALAEDARQWVMDEIAMLRYKIAPIVHTDTGLFYEVDRGLVSVDHLVDGLASDIGALGVSIGEWTGDAARNFRGSFYLPFGDIRLHQRGLVKWLRDGLSTSKAIIDLAQLSLMQAVAGTKSALCEQLRLRSVDREEASAQEVRFLAFATGLFSALTFEMPPVSASFAALSVTLDYAADELEKGSNTAPYEIKGRTAEDLITKLFEAVQQILDSVDQNYDELESRLRNLESEVADLRRVDPDRGHSYLIAARPDLVDGVEPDEFYHESSSR
jgi:hypothetical protein